MAYKTLLVASDRRKVTPLVDVIHRIAVFRFRGLNGHWKWMYLDCAPFFEMKSWRSPWHYHDHDSSYHFNHRSDDNLLQTNVHRPRIHFNPRQGMRVVWLDGVLICWFWLNAHSPCFSPPSESDLCSRHERFTLVLNSHQILEGKAHWDYLHFLGSASVSPSYINDLILFIIHYRFFFSYQTNLGSVSFSISTPLPSVLSGTRFSSPLSISLSRDRGKPRAWTEHPRHRF